MGKVDHHVWVFMIQLLFSDYLFKAHYVKLIEQPKGITVFMMLSVPYQRSGVTEKNWLSLSLLIYDLVFSDSSLHSTGSQIMTQFGLNINIFH